MSLATALADEVRLRVRSDDEERLFALKQYGVLDTEVDGRYELVVEAMQAQCEVPMAAIAFVDRDRMWMKAGRGFEGRSVPRSLCFCSVCIHENPPLVVEDASVDPRFCENELVTGASHLRFYTGFPIFSWDGFGLGSLCVADTLPRSLLLRQMKLLEKARDWVEEDLDLRLLSARFSEGLSEAARSVHTQRLSYAAVKERQAWEAVASLL